MGRKGESAAPESVSVSRVDDNGKALAPIEYKELDLNASWDRFDVRHELTDKGIEKFMKDYKSALASAA